MTEVELGTLELIGMTLEPNMIPKVEKAGSQETWLFAELAK